MLTCAAVVSILKPMKTCKRMPAHHHFASLGVEGEYSGAVWYEERDGTALHMTAYSGVNPFIMVRLHHTHPCRYKCIHVVFVLHVDPLLFHCQALVFLDVSHRHHVASEMQYLVSVSNSL